MTSGVFRKHAILAVLCVLVMAPAAVSQSFWLDPERGNSLSVEYFRINFVRRVSFTSTTSTFFFTGKLAVSRNTWLVAELPFVHADVELDSYFPFSQPEAENAFGNPYFGLRSSLQPECLFIDFGVRIPIAKEHKYLANSYGFESEINRFGAFLVDYITLKMQLEALTSTDEGPFLRGKLCPMMFVGIQENSSDEIEFLANVGGQFGYRSQKARIWGGLQGLYALTEESLFSGDRTVAELSVGTDFRFSQLAPGFVLRAPITTKYQDRITLIYGVNLSWHFN